MPPDASMAPLTQTWPNTNPFVIETVCKQSPQYSFIIRVTFWWGQYEMATEKESLTKTNKIKSLTLRRFQPSEHEQNSLLKCNTL